MNTLQQIMPTLQRSAWQNALPTGQAEPVTAWRQTQTTGLSLSAFRPNGIWEDSENRRFYMESCVEQDMAWQIKINRVERGWSQAELARKVGTRQSAISRLEDESYGRYSIPLLIRIAHAFECALLVKLVPYSRFAEEVKDTSISGRYVASFEDEKYLLGAQK